MKHFLLFRENYEDFNPFRLLQVAICFTKMIFLWEYCNTRMIFSSSPSPSLMMSSTTSQQPAKSMGFFILYGIPLYWFNIYTYLIFIYSYIKKEKEKGERWSKVIFLWLNGLKCPIYRWLITMSDYMFVPYPSYHIISFFPRKSIPYNLVFHYCHGQENLPFLH